MGIEGIGARALRKEDKRFITGKGRYVDDIRIYGMTYAAFVRSPHAHAKVTAIDTAPALEMPGVVAVLTGKELVDDKIGNLICGWMIHSKDGSPMKMGAWPAMAPETVRFVGQAVAVVIAETKNLARDAAEAVVVEYEELPSIPDIAAAAGDMAPTIFLVTSAPSMMAKSTGNVLLGGGRTWLAEHLLVEGAPNGGLDFGLCLLGALPERAQTPDEFGGPRLQVFGDVIDHLGTIVPRNPAPAAGLGSGLDRVADILAVAEPGEAQDSPGPLHRIAVA